MKSLAVIGQYPIIKVDWVEICQNMKSLAVVVQNGVGIAFIMQKIKFEICVF